MVDQYTLFGGEPEAEHDESAAAVSNQKLCSLIEPELSKVGFTKTENEPLKMGAYTTRSTFQDMYGCQRRSAFLIHHPRFGLVRVEAHRQIQSGSVDQKFPFFLQSLLGCLERVVALVLEGGGYKPEAYRWLERESQRYPHKTIKLFSDTPTFIAWLADDQQS